MITGRVHMKKASVLLMVVLLVFGLTGCGKEDNPITDDLKQYLEQIALIQSIHDGAVSAYNSYFNNEDISSNDLVVIINDQVVVGFEEYIEKLEAIETTTDEVTDLKIMYADSVKLQYDAMVIISTAIGEKNTEKLSEASTMLSDAANKYDEYKNQLKTLAEDNNISLMNSSETRVDTSEE